MDCGVPPLSLWIDVSAPPGAGKSTICNPIWHEHGIAWDGKLPPAHWRPFLDEMTSLFGVIRDHWSFVPAVRMNNRSIRKMATVARIDDGKGPYVQTGLVQRGLGFGWRIVDQGGDVNLIRRYFELMPVSIGVAFLTADLATLTARNKARELVSSTAHENRTYQLEPVLPAIKIAKEVLHARGVPVIEVDVQHQTPDEARAKLVEFAANSQCEAARMTSCSQHLLQSPPPWWQ